MDFQHFLFAACIGLLPATAIADPAADSPVAPYFEDLPVVLTPSRLPQSLPQAPAAVTVLDRATIRATGYRDISRLLRLVPGMQVGQERGGVHWVTYHGLGNDAPFELQVLVDGRALYSSSTIAGVEWLPLAVNIEDIERIEIVRGTDAVAYGPNAFLGVVNIITRSGGDTSDFRITTRVGNAGIRDVGVGLAGAFESTRMRGSVTASQDSGFAGLRDDSRNRVANLRSDSRLSDRDELTMNISGSDLTRELGYADSYMGTNPQRPNTTRTQNFHLQWRREPAVGEELLVNFFRNESSASDEWTTVVPRPDLEFSRSGIVHVTRNYRGVRNSLEAQYRLAPTDTTRLVSGAEVRDEWIHAPYMFHDRISITSSLYRAFASAEQGLTRDLTINAGGMASKYSWDRVRWSPRVFANWQAGTGSTLRAGYSRAWRDVNHFERQADVQLTDSVDGRNLYKLYLPNPDLRPSRIDSVELGYLGRIPKFETTVDVRLFRERIKDLIIRGVHPELARGEVLDPYLLPTRFDNLDSALTLNGIEYQIRTRPWQDTQLQLSHTIIQRRTASRAITDRVAPYSASASWLQRYPGEWSTMLTVLRMGPAAGADGYVPRSPYRTRPYTTYDFNVSKRIRWSGSDWEFSLTGTNLGPRHQEIPDRSEQYLHPEGPANQTSRMIYLSVRIETP